MISRQRGYVSQGQLELESQKGDTEADWHARIGTTEIMYTLNSVEEIQSF